MHGRPLGHGSSTTPFVAEHYLGKPQAQTAEQNGHVPSALNGSTPHDGIFVSMIQLAAAAQPAATYVLYDLEPRQKKIHEQQNIQGAR